MRFAQDLQTRLVLPISARKSTCPRLDFRQKSKNLPRDQFSVNFSIFRSNFLENRTFPGDAVFAGCSSTIISTILARESTKSMARFSSKVEKPPPGPIFGQFFDLSVQFSAEPGFSRTCGFRPMFKHNYFYHFQQEKVEVHG